MNLQLVLFGLLTLASLCLQAGEFKAAESIATGHGQKAVATSAPAIAEADLRRFVTRLASAEYEGRGTGDKGERMATAYLAAFFEGLGLQQAGDGESYFQGFEFPAGMTLQGENSLSFPDGVPPGLKRNLTPGEHYQPLSLSTAATVHAKVVFAGFGIETKDYHSFDGLDVKDRWVIVLRGHPRPRRNLSQFGPLMVKAQLAKDEGAAGIIFVKGTNPAVSPELFAPNTMVGGREQILPAITITDRLAASLLTGKAELEGLQALFASYNTGENIEGFELKNRLTAKIGIAPKQDSGRNVVARLVAGDTPSAEAVVIGAHIDHLGYGNRGGSRARGEEAKEIHFGADDNASGVAAMMELAQFLIDQKKAGKLKLKRDLIFAGWSGEELGLYGSTHYVASAKADLNGGDLHPQFAAYINLDMVGRARSGGVTIQGLASSNSWPEILQQADATDLKIKRSPSPYLPTDTTPFYNSGVPVLAAFTGMHKDYHTPRDTIETVDFEGLHQVTRYIRSIAVAIANRPEAPDYVKVARNSPNAPKVRIGARLENADNGGVKFAQVVPASPAARAGLRDGDVLMKFHETAIGNRNDLTRVLRKLKADQEYKIEVQRGEESIVLKIIPEKR